MVVRKLLRNMSRENGSKRAKEKFLWRLPLFEVSDLELRAGWEAIIAHRMQKICNSFPVQPWCLGKTLRHFLLFD